MVCNEPFYGELGGVLLGVFLAGENGPGVAEALAVLADADEAGEEVEARAGLLVVGAWARRVRLSVF